jgi:hypothetical protein
MRHFLRSCDISSTIELNSGLDDHISVPPYGLPTSLGPGLRTASRAKRMHGGLPPSCLSQWHCLMTYFQSPAPKSAKHDSCRSARSDCKIGNDCVTGRCDARRCDAPPPQGACFMRQRPNSLLACKIGDGDPLKTRPFAPFSAAKRRGLICPLPRRTVSPIPYFLTLRGRAGQSGPGPRTMIRAKEVRGRVSQSDDH